MNTTELTLDNLEQKVQQLPSLSAIVTRLLALLQDTDITMAALTTEISKDQALTARVLRIANSPFYGMSSHIDNLQQAGTLLGLHTIHGIITAVGIIGHFPPQENQRFDCYSFWLHSIGTGCCAQVIARHTGLDPEQAFTAGLLHDIGKLVLAAYFEDNFSRVLAWRDKHDCLIREAEESVLGFDHTKIGARVAQHWKLPKLLVNAIHFHHALPDKITLLAELVHLADILCRGLDIGNGGDDLIPELHPDVLPRLGLDWLDLRAMLPEIEEVNSHASMLLDDI
ncbi:hypothetical protein MNBD_GAMMA25-779 [hydrothermal vent metagenome]|uniref:HDOD domain-containing protein n=1 Tax=hydrothermal vent metagenome TaxID=652676 RepID=A0A3B1B9R4_9ZZZZ